MKFNYVTMLNILIGMILILDYFYFDWGLIWYGVGLICLIQLIFLIWVWRSWLKRRGSQKAYRDRLESLSEILMEIGKGKG